MSELEREKFEAQVRRQIGDRGRKTAFRQYNGKYEAAWLQSRWEGWLDRSESAPSNLNSQEFQSALGKLALAMGNPCIEFEAGKIEIGLIKYATEFINRSQK